VARHGPNGDATVDADTAAQLLAYAEATFGAVTSMRRRVGAVALALALLFALAGLIAAGAWQSTRAEAAAIEDRALVDTLGVTVPDPRPAVERLALRARATLFGIGAVAAFVLSLPCFALWLLVRPPPPPVTRQPPM
jgi:hypothetical protein